MAVSVAVVAQDAAMREQLVGLVPTDTFTVASYDPETLPDSLPAIFIIALPAMESPEETLIESLRADESKAGVPIVIASALPMQQLQSVDYISSDLTMAIVEHPVEQQILLDTMGFLLGME